MTSFLVEVGLNILIAFESSSPTLFYHKCILFPSKHRNGLNAENKRFRLENVDIAITDGPY